ncbi:MAG: hypothetical protein AB1540_09980 [Bdellovibrionota bacterium]
MSEPVCETQLLVESGRSVQVIEKSSFELAPGHFVGKVLTRMPIETLSDNRPSFKVINPEGGLMEWPGGSNSMNYTRLRAVFERSPGFAQTYHFFAIRTANGVFHEKYLDLEAINALIDELRKRGDPFAPATMFEQVDKGLEAVEYLALRSRKRAPYASKGFQHQHDYSGIHGVTEILVPSQLVDYIAHAASALLMLHTDATLSKHPENRAVIGYALNSVADTIDVETGELGVRILGQLYENGKKLANLPIDDNRVRFAITNQLHGLVTHIERYLQGCLDHAQMKRQHGLASTEELSIWAKFESTVNGYPKPQDFDALAKQVIAHVNRSRPAWMPAIP